MTAIAPFSTTRLPRIVFGEGAIDALSTEARAFGTRALVVTGRRSLRDLPVWRSLNEALEIETVVVADEPSPDLVDAAVAKFHGSGIDVVIGLGGGSALDAAKAIAGLMVTGNSVMDHIEGVGRGIAYDGPSLPFIAAPSTAGTGTEATKNAVLSSRGPAGFKKSFRDDQLVAQVAIVDPELLQTCPQALISANGMDAFTQLLEGYVSPKASAMTDALAWSGLEAFARGFFAAWEEAGRQSARASAGRADIAYASLMSGITLAQTGLGSVHALASPLGAFFPAPHGVVCGTLLAVATEINIRALKERDPENIALAKYARVGRLLSGTDDGLVATLADWTERTGIAKLGEFGMTAEEVGKVVAASNPGGMKSNPLILSSEEVTELVERRL
ncbi:MAG: iron-containing alcohol dehydrogenase [Rhodospirillales bacterium]|jgi:alcohol dehydrogenase class IV|nr:iron-containing alcohol dehydrogenase [Rhodospirillales bacterium]